MLFRSAPSLNPEELEKRIGELKAVHFWLEQNSRALGATIQALEVQKMTLATLKGMNFNLGDVASAFKFKAADAQTSAEPRAPEKAATAASKTSGAASNGSDPDQAAAKSDKSAEGVAAMVDPMQLWGALTQQFQQIAAGALKDVASNPALDATKNIAAGFASEVAKVGKKLATSSVAPRAPAKKTAQKTTPRAR